MSLQPRAQITIPLPAHLVEQLDRRVLDRRQADGPGTRITRTSVIREFIEVGLNANDCVPGNAGQPVRVRTRKPFLDTA